MRGYGLSQLPVAKGEMPLAAAEILGAVDELALMDRAFHDPAVLDEPVEKVMGDRLPTIGIGQPIALAGRAARPGARAGGAGRRAAAGGAEPHRRAASTCPRARRASGASDHETVR